MPLGGGPTTCSSCVRSKACSPPERPPPPTSEFCWVTCSGVVVNIYHIPALLRWRCLVPVYLADCRVLSWQLLSPLPESWGPLGAAFWNLWPLLVGRGAVGASPQLWARGSRRHGRVAGCCPELARPAHPGTGSFGRTSPPHCGQAEDHTGLPWCLFCAHVLRDAGGGLSGTRLVLAPRPGPQPHGDGPCHRHV